MISHINCIIFFAFFCLVWNWPWLALLWFRTNEANGGCWLGHMDVGVVVVVVVSDVDCMWCGWCSLDVVCDVMLCDVCVPVNSASTQCWSSGCVLFLSKERSVPEEVFAEKLRSRYFKCRWAGLCVCLWVSGVVLCVPIALCVCASSVLMSQLHRDVGNRQAATTNFSLSFLFLTFHCIFRAPCSTAESVDKVIQALNIYISNREWRIGLGLGRGRGRSGMVEWSEHWMMCFGGACEHDLEFFFVVGEVFFGDVWCGDHGWGEMERYERVSVFSLVFFYYL